MQGRRNHAKWDDTNSYQAKTNKDAANAPEMESDQKAIHPDIDSEYKRRDEKSHVEINRVVLNTDNGSRKMIISAITVA